MARAKVDIQAAFGDAIYATAPTWTTITSYLNRGTLNRGRGTPLEQFPPGTLDLEFDISDGELDPENGGGSYAGDLVENLRLRARCTANAVTYDLGEFLVDTWDVQYEHPGYATARVTATDFLKVLGQGDTTAGGFAAGLTGTRAGDILTDVDFPTFAGWRDIASGLCPVIAIPDGTSVRALTHLQTMAESEGILAAVFMTNANALRFDDASAPATRTGMASVQQTLSELGADAATAAKARDIRWGYYDGTVRGVASGTSAAGPTTVLEDATAKAASGGATYSPNHSQIALDSYSVAALEGGLVVAKDKRYGAKSLRVRGLADDVNLARAVSLELRDRVAVKTTASTAAATSLNLEHTVEQIRIEFGNAGIVDVSLGLMLADWIDAQNGDNWIEIDGGATDGSLGGSRRVGY